jgi:hypothetical protein
VAALARGIEGETRMSLLDCSLWTALAPYIDVETYDRDGSARDPRFRLEFQRMPALLTAAALAVTVPCAECGRPMHPIRARQGPGNKRSEHVGQHLYLAAACPLEVNVGCSRGTGARLEYRRIRRAVEAAALREPATQPTLPGFQPEHDDTEGARRAIQRRNETP